MSSSGDHHEETGPEPSPPEQPKPRCALCMEGDYETCDGKHPCQVCTVIGRPRECHYPRAGKVAKKVQVKEEPNQHQAPITIEDSDSNNLVCRQELVVVEAQSPTPLVFHGLPESPPCLDRILRSVRVIPLHPQPDTPHCDLSWQECKWRKVLEFQRQFQSTWQEISDTFGECCISGYSFFYPQMPLSWLIQASMARTTPNDESYRNASGPARPPRDTGIPSDETPGRFSLVFPPENNTSCGFEFSTGMVGDGAVCGDRSHHFHMRFDKVLTLKSIEELRDEGKGSVQSQLCGHNWCLNLNHQVIESIELNDTRQTCHRLSIFLKSDGVINQRYCHNALHRETPCRSLSASLSVLECVVAEYLLANRTSIDGLTARQRGPIYPASKRLSPLQRRITVDILKPLDARSQWVAPSIPRTNNPLIEFDDIFDQDEFTLLNSIVGQKDLRKKKFWLDGLRRWETSLPRSVCPQEDLQSLSGLGAASLAVSCQMTCSLCLSNTFRTLRTGCDKPYAFVNVRVAICHWLVFHTEFTPSDRCRFIETELQQSDFLKISIDEIVMKLGAQDLRRSKTVRTMAQFQLLLRSNDLCSLATFLGHNRPLTPWNGIRHRHAPPQPITSFEMMQSANGFY